MKRPSKRDLLRAPLDWREMEKDPGLRGMEEFLAPRLVPFPASPQTSAGGAPDFSVGASAYNSGAPDIATHSAPHITIVRRLVRPASTVQDGHSRSENDLYSEMYKRATPIEGSASRRLVIGTRTLAKHAGMAYSTCQCNLASLERKLAIRSEGEADSRQNGKVWLVYSFGEILRRRRQAGLTHFVRTTKGVSLVRPHSAPDLIAGAPTIEAGAPAIGAPDLENGAPQSESGAPIAGALLEIDDDERENKPSSLSFQPLIEECHHVNLTFDDDAARRLFARCRASDPAATVAEVAHFLRIKLNQFRNKRNVQNAVGLLIASVPQYFAQPATELTKMRQVWREQERIRQAAHEQYMSEQNEGREENPV